MNLRDKTALMAYEIWMERGEQHGSDQEDWYRAEDIVGTCHPQPFEGSADSTRKRTRAKKMPVEGKRRNSQKAKEDAERG